MTRIRDDHRWCVDRNGDVWRRNRDGTWWGARDITTDELEAEYGPLTPLVPDDGNRVTLEWGERGDISIFAPNGELLTRLLPESDGDMGFTLPPKRQTLEEYAAEVIGEFLPGRGADPLAAATEAVQALKDAGLLKDGNDG